MPKQGEYYRIVLPPGVYTTHRFPDGYVFSFRIPNHMNMNQELEISVLETPIRDQMTYGQQEGRKMTSEIRNGDLILTANDKLSVVKSVESKMKGAVVYHTNNGDFKPGDILASFHADYVDTTPEKEEDSTSKLAVAIEKLTRKLS